MAIDEMKPPTPYELITRLEKRVKRLEEEAEINNRIFNKRLIELEYPD